MTKEIEVYNKPLTAAEIKANVNRLQEVMKAVMIKDVHYGVIPGTQKPTLYKAGSEKILSTFRIAVELDVEDLSTADAYRYRVKARGVIPSGEIVGCGIGECSTDEEKYRWRSVVNEKEWDATPDDRKRVKYSKPNNWNKDGETKQVRTNPADLANTVLKMAKKRAQIDLTLTATAASDVFEQDLEDMPEEIRDGMRHEQPTGGKPEVKPPQARSDQTGTINQNQVKLLMVKIKAAGITEDAFKAHYGIESVSNLPFDKMNEALEALKNGDISGQPSLEAVPVCPDCQRPLDGGVCRTDTCPRGEP